MVPWFDKKEKEKKKKQRGRWINDWSFWAAFAFSRLEILFEHMRRWYNRCSSPFRSDRHFHIFEGGKLWIIDHHTVLKGGEACLEWPPISIKKLCSFNDKSGSARQEFFPSTMTPEIQNTNVTFIISEEVSLFEGFIQCFEFRASLLMETISNVRTRRTFTLYIGSLIP